MVERARRHPSSSKTKRDQFSTLNDEALLAGLRAEEPGAFLEIVRRYQELVFKYARQLGVRAEEQREWVTDLFHDVVLSLIKPGAIVPSSLGSYFARACRNKAYMAYRTRTRRARRESAASTPDSEGGSIVTTLCSEAMLRNARGVDLEVADGLSVTLQRFTKKLEANLSPDDRQLLDWSTESVPLRLIAEWEGISRDAAAHRLSRLKNRLRKLTPAILDEFDSADRAEIERFLRGGSRNV